MLSLQEVHCEIVLMQGDREGGPTIFAEVKNGKNVEHIVELILSAWRACGADESYRARMQRQAAP